MKNKKLSFHCPPFPAFISCGYQLFKPGEMHCDRVFPAFVLMFVIEGTVYFTEDNIQHELSAGEWFIQTPGIRHFGHRASSSEAKYFWIHFIPFEKWDIYPANSPANSMEEHGTSAVTIFDSGHGIRKPELQIRLKMNQPYSADVFTSLFSDLYEAFSLLQEPIRAQSIFTNILDKMTKEYAHKKQNSKTVLSYQVQEFIILNFKTDLHLGDVAKKYSFSQDYIARCFKKTFGLSPYNYLLRPRLDYAKMLLASTSKSIEEIAVETGYKDLAVFSRMFKTASGQSPLKYRKKVWNI